MKYQVVVINGPSGSGKNTIMTEVLNQCEETTRLVTACTRDMRPGEVEGVDYYFISKEEFEAKIETGEIPEYNADQARETGTYRGIIKAKLDEKIATGKTVIAQIQLQGLEYMRENYNTVGIFIQTSSLEELEERITSRADLSPEELQSRLAIARDEIENQAKHYDYQITNENGKLDDAVQQVIDIIS